MRKELEKKQDFIAILKSSAPSKWYKMDKVDGEKQDFILKGNEGIRA